MIVIETREQAPHFNQTDADNYVSHVSHLLDVELMVTSVPQQHILSFIKGLIATVAMMAMSGLDASSPIGIALCVYVPTLFALIRWRDQTLSGTVSSKDVVRSLKRDLSLLHPTLFALVPMFLLLCSMSLQSFVNAFATLIEVAGIAVGVPLLIFGAIKWSEKQTSAMGHLKLGAASIVLGTVLSLILAVVTSRLLEVNSLSPANYFGEAITTVYAPNMVLDDTSH